MISDNIGIYPENFLRITSWIVILLLRREGWMDERSKGIVEKFWEKRNWNVNVENLFPLGAVILFRSAPRPLFRLERQREKKKEEKISRK